MKTVKYLFMSLLVGTLGIGVIEAKSNPTFTSSLNVTNVSGTDRIKVEAVVKNSTTTCDGIGLKSGKVYIYLDENIVERASSIEGVYKNYLETTNGFSKENVICSYDGSRHRVGCTFGRNITNPALVAYSDCKDELVITFETALCEGSTNCDIRVDVEGEAIDYNNGKPISISNGVQTMMSENFNCNSTSTNPPIDTPVETPTEPEENEPTNNPTIPDNDTIYEPNENPNTMDNGTLYMLIATLSLVLIVTTINVKKKKEA